MTLHSLVLHGFKSFPERTRINFLHPVSAIVGPNGCGKSNIVDALRWVLGESSSNSVRGSKMADVIFSGSNGRAARVQASVELLLHNTNQMFSGAFAQYQEISVSRHIFTDGKSNYQINGSRVKKKDIVDLFSGTGLGHNSYSIIEQGMVSQLVTSKPTELKGYIEEVAGVSQFHARKHETHNRLERTRKNLLRLQDLVRALEVQEKHLRQQVKVATEYSRIKDEVSRLEYTLVVQNYQQITDKLARTQSRYQQYEELHQKSMVAQAEIELRMSEQYTLLGDYQTRLEQAEKKQQELVFAVQMLDEKITWHTNEQARVEREQAHLVEKQQATQQAQFDIAQQIKEHEERLHAMTRTDESQWRALEAESASLVQQQALFQQETNKQLQFYKEQAIAYERAHEAYVRALRESEQLEAQYTHTAIKDQHDEITARIEQAKRTQAELLERTQTHATKRARISALIVTKNQQSQVQQQQVRTSEKELQNLLNEQRVVEQLLRAKGAGGDSATMQGELLQEQAVIAHDWTAAFDALFAEHWYYIQNEQASDANATSHCYQFSSRFQPRQTHPALQSLRTCVTNAFPLPSFCALGFVMVDETHLTEVRHTLLAGEWVLLRSGDIVGYDWYKKAPTETDGLVKLRAKKEELQQACRTHAKTHDTLTHRANLYQKQATRLQSHLAHYAEQTRQLEKEQAVCSRRIYEDEMALANHAKTTQHATWLAEQIKQKQTQCAELERVCESTKNSQAEYDCYTQKVAQEAAEYQVDIERKNTHYQEAKLAWHRQQDEHQNMQKQLVLLRERKQELDIRAQQDQAQAELIAKHEVVDMSDLTAQLTARKDQTQTHAHQTDALREQQRVARTTMDALKKELAHATEQERIHDINKNKQKALLESLEPQLATHTADLQEKNISPETALAVAAEAAQEDIDHKRRHAQAQAALEKIGAVNLLAEQEHTMCSERLADMNRQHDEIMQAITNLEEAIDNIDTEAQKRLSEIVDRINEQLVLICQSVFKGGHCSLHATEDNSGIEIQTQLPGKKQFSLRLLSGGERALVAITFIFALFSLNPAPFCVFDEVDAPLDDANAAALADMIADYKNRVQFIVVTHNKIMMSKADDLLGITMSESGVSRFVPVNIEQALAWQSR